MIVKYFKLSYLILNIKYKYIYRARYDQSNEGARYIGPGSTSDLPGFKFELNEGGLRVPSFIYYPKLIQEHIYIENIPFSNIDILPTLIEFNPEQFSFVKNMLSNAKLDGISMVPYMRNHEIIRERPFGIIDNEFSQYLTFTNYTAVAVKQAKFIDFLNINKNQYSTVPEITVYFKSKKEWYLKFLNWKKSYGPSKCVNI